MLSNLNDAHVKSTESLSGKLKEKLHKPPAFIYIYIYISSKEDHPRGEKGIFRTPRTGEVLKIGHENIALTASGK